MSNLTTAQKAKVKENLRRLDYLEGTGVIAARKRRLADEVFLFISTGGNGHKTLSTLRRQLEWKVESAELQSRVRFLAIDTAHREIEELHDQGFSREETFFIPFEGAHDSIRPDTISPQMKEWVDPKLYDETGGSAQTAPALSGFDDSGAGAWRQPGRVRLCQPNTISKLRESLTPVIKGLMSEHISRRRLNIFFLAGIAGGTGSGTIIDLPFLTRQIVKELDVQVYQNTKVSAYLLMPSACGSPVSTSDRNKGNCNAYAALKEIDYFMGLQDRGERFCRLYDTFMVEIDENIFDFCTLVEGVGGTLFKEPDRTAQLVTANSILNLIAVQDAKAGNEPFLVDSFLSNRTQQIKNAVHGRSHKVWPRDANYVYNVIGYAACVVPIDLMTVYVANKVFVRLWDRFEKHKEADPEEALQFLADCGLSAEQVRRSKLDNIFKEIDRVADTCFKEKGPYFMVNLLLGAVDALHEDGSYKKYAQKKSVSALTAKTRNEWERAVERYDRIEKKFLEMNNSLYDVYTFVLDEMKDLFRDNARLLTDTKEYKNLFQSSFCWSPIDLSAGEAADNAVLLYLDTLLSEEEIEEKAKKFVNLLCSKKDEWTQLDPPKEKSAAAFAAARLIRGFIQEEFKVIVDDTMESFLVKLYSGDPNARVPELDKKQAPESHIPVEKAAEELVDNLSKRAHPLVQTCNHFSLDACSKNLYMTVPDGCRWLDQEIISHANNCRVYQSSAQDEVVFYRLYVGVPAWALSWVAEAERTYDRSPNAVGLHIEKGVKSHDWVRFPNLTNDRFWGNAYRKELHSREIELYDSARTDLETARGLDLVQRISNESGPDEFEVYTLCSGRQDMSAEGLYQLAAPAGDRQYVFTELLQSLVQQGILEPHTLKYVNEVTTTTETPVPEDLCWDLACRALRRMLALWDNVKETIAVAEQLRTLLEEHNRKVLNRHRIIERRQVFLNCLAGGLIQYNELRARWEDLSRTDRQILGEPLVGKLKQECKEYYAAQAFYALEDKRYQWLCEALKKRNENATDEECAALLNRRAELKEIFCTMRGNEEDGGKTSYPMASLDFEEAAGADAQAIRDFYTWMTHEL